MAVVVTTSNLASVSSAESLVFKAAGTLPVYGAVYIRLVGNQFLPQCMALWAPMVLWARLLGMSFLREAEPPCTAPWIELSHMVLWEKLSPMAP